MRTVFGRAALEPTDGPLLAAVGVFDGLHRGHAWLIEQLVGAAAARAARPGVITFDAHPDAVLVGAAPPLLMDPDQRRARLAALGVEVVVIEHFDDRLRRTPYDAFVAGIVAGCPLAGFVMTPDAAFGHERAGTPTTLAELGDREGFEVIVVPPFELDGREVRSSDIRAAIAAGDLATAERLLGRPYALRGAIRDGRLELALPMALPPAGHYDGRVAGRTAELIIADGSVGIPSVTSAEPVDVELPA